MRVLVSAYAAEPDAGSEPGVGWSWALAAARAGHDVTLLTRRNNRVAIDDELRQTPDVTLRPLYLDLSTRALEFKRRLSATRSYYVLWQAAARRLIEQVHAKHPFDVTHHLTFAVDWLPAGCVGIPGLPSVWGPVGGATQPPLALRRHLGIGGNAAAISRGITGGLGRRTWGRSSAQTADVVVALNPDVASSLGRWSTPELEPNSAFDVAALREAGEPSPAGNGSYRAVFVGRLEAWKGLTLALAALSASDAARWTLDIYGDGPDASRAKRYASKLGLGERARFHGRVPRPQVIEAMNTADALLHPALHDSAPWTVAEAATLGTPTVCLDLGGPPTLAAPCRVLAVEPSREAPRLLAHSLKQLEHSPPPQPTDRWTEARLPSLLDRWYTTAVCNQRRRASG